MEKKDILAIIQDAMADIAPEAEWDDVQADENLREQLDIDSMDFLNFLEALQSKTRITIPETDYEKVETLNQLVNYVADRMT